MKRLMVVAGFLALSGCADYLAVDDAGHTTAEPPKNTMTTPGKGDTCHAAALQYLVGKNKAEAPAPVDPSKRRTYCSTCAVPAGYVANRLNIIFDDKSGTIAEVKCG